MARSRGFRRKTRHILSKDRVRGLSYLLYNYSIGDRVSIVIDPREHKGMPHRRYHGKVGIVEGIYKRALKVRVRIGDKDKILYARLAHIKPLSSGE